MDHMPVCSTRKRARPANLYASWVDQSASQVARGTRSFRFVSFRHHINAFSAQAFFCSYDNRSLISRSVLGMTSKLVGGGVGIDLASGGKEADGEEVEEGCGVRGGGRSQPGGSLEGSGEEGVVLISLSEAIPVSSRDKVRSFG
jgi:hypothetical protein